MTQRVVDYVFRIAEDQVTNRFRAVAKAEEEMRRRMAAPLPSPRFAGGGSASPPLGGGNAFPPSGGGRRPPLPGGRSGPHNLGSDAMGMMSNQFVQLFGIAGAAMAIKKGIDDLSTYEDQISLLSQKFGEPVAKLGEVKKELLALSLTRGIRQDAAQLAEAANILAGADYNKAATLAITKAAAKGSSATLSNLTTVTRGLMSVMKGFKIDSADAELTLSKMMKTANLGTIELENLSGSMAQVVAPSIAAGASLDTVLALLSTLSVSGVSDAAEASTAIARMMEHFTKRDFRYMAKGAFKIDIADAKGNMRPLIDILSDMGKTYEKLGSGTKKNDFIEQLLGAGDIRAGRALLPLIKNLDVVLRQFEEIHATGVDFLGKQSAEAAERLGDKLAHAGNIVKNMSMDFATLFIPFIDWMDASFPEGDAAGSLADHIRGVIKMAANTIAKEGWSGYIWRAIMMTNSKDNRDEHAARRKERVVWGPVDVAQWAWDKAAETSDKSAPAGGNLYTAEERAQRKTKSDTDIANARMPSMFNELRKDPLSGLNVADYSRPPVMLQPVFHVKVNTVVAKDGTSQTATTITDPSRHAGQAGGRF